MKPWLQPGYEEPPDGKEYLVSQERMNVIHKESLCINCGCCVSECNSMESDPDFLGPAALAKGMRFVGDPRDGAKIERLEDYNAEHGIWDCTRCYFCTRALPEGRRPARRDREARRRVDRSTGSTATWARSTRSGSSRRPKTTGWLRETELVPKTQGVVSAIEQMKFALGLADARARCRRRSRRTSPRTCSEARALLRPRQGAGPGRAPPASSRASSALGADRAHARASGAQRTGDAGGRAPRRRAAGTRKE